MFLRSKQKMYITVIVENYNKIGQAGNGGAVMNLLLVKRHLQILEFEVTRLTITKSEIGF